MRPSDFLLIVSGVLSMTMAGSAATRYVNLNNPAPLAPYTSWATAATNIQTAVDAAAAGDEIVVTNGTYASGGRALYGVMTNRVAIDKAVTVRSVNGPAVTIIEGRAAPEASDGNGLGAVRCVYVGTNAVLSGFTLTNGHTLRHGDCTMGSGGGAWCAVSGVIINCNLIRNSTWGFGGGTFFGTLSNCTLMENFADQGGGGAECATLYNCILSGNSSEICGGGAERGTLYNCTLTGNFSGDTAGGAYAATLYNCILSGNSADFGGGACSCALDNCMVSRNSAQWGGGAFSGTLNNCTLSGNSAYLDGGGAAYATLTNCIIHYNVAPNGPNFYGSTSKFSYCCSMPLPPGPGNIEAAPGFVDTNGWSNLRLQASSPCINAGANRFVSASTDLDGSPRIAGGTVDMGAYELQSPSSIISYDWLQQYGFSIDGLADLKDSDVDGLNNWQEWIAGTNPTNSCSALRMLAVQPASSTPNGITVSWTSVTNRTYCLERALVLGTAPGFGVVRRNITGLDSTTTFTDTNATGSGPFFYRVRVEN